MSEDWWESRARRRRFPFYRGFFEDTDEFMRELDRQIEEEFRWISEHTPKELVREKTTKEGVKREYGPFVYGYSFTVGPDGKPVIREFGNIRPRLMARGPALQLKGEREPVVDVIDEEKQVRVIAELPGVQKENIELRTSEDRLTIRVETEKHKYFKEVDLPSVVEPDTSKATYTNGVLEVTLNKKKEEERKGLHIKVE